MKKNLFLLLSLFTVFPIIARDFTYTYEGKTITYTVIDENARTCMTKAGDFSTGGNSVTGDLTLPSNPHDGDIEFTLTQVGDFTFFKCDELTSASLPATITSIGDYAFCQCKKMTSVNIPDAVTSIGMAAFSGCRQLSSTIIIPDAVTEIGHSAFATCWNVETIKIGNSLKEIQFSTFNSCLSLKNLTIGNSVEKIGGNAFSNCGDLTDIYIPASVRYIDSNPFEDSGLEKAEFESIESLCNIEFSGSGSNPLAYAGHLYINGEEVTNLVIPNSVTSIGNYAFINCSSISSVCMGNTITNIGNDSFRNCTNLKSIDIPTSVTAIGDAAFYNCKVLTEIVIPNSVTTIGASAFAECTGVKNILLGSALTTMGSFAFYGCENVNSIVIPNSVTTIGNSAFQNCFELDDIIIGHGLKSLYSHVFDNTKASRVYITAKTPPSGDIDVFSNHGILMVPASESFHYSYYYAWKDFTDRRDLVDATSVTIQTTEFSGKPGDSFQIEASVLPDNTTLKYVTYRSTNPAVATVDNYGQVTIQNGFEDFLTNTDGENSYATCKIIVESLYADCPPSEVLIKAYSDNPYFVDYAHVEGTVDGDGNGVYNFNHRGLDSLIVADNYDNRLIVEDFGKRYHDVFADLTDEIFTTKVGSIIKIKGVPYPAAYAGNWTCSYFYIDFDNNKRFDVDQSIEDANNDLVVYNGYGLTKIIKSGTTGLYDTEPDSSSVKLDGTRDWYDGWCGDTYSLPEFQLPTDMNPGCYRVRYKNDWNSTHPYGRTNETLYGKQCEDNGIMRIGGMIIDFTINVKKNDELLALEDIGEDGNQSVDFSQPYDVYNMQGVRISDSLKGIMTGLYVVRQGSVAVKIAVK